MRRLLVLLLAVLASVAAAEAPRRSLAAQEAVQSPVPVPDAEKAKALGVDLEAEAVQEAVEQQSAYDAELYSQQHNAAASSALFVGGARTTPCRAPGRSRPRPSTQRLSAAAPSTAS